MDQPSPPPKSPNWDSTTKMVVGLTIIAVIAALLIYFRGIIGPLILAFILAFLLHPVAAWTNKLLNTSWRVSVNLIYLILVILFGVLVTLTGLALLQQTQSLVSFVERFITGLPDMVQELSFSTRL
jgi:predicted PurR-regulated permease PerM